METFADVRISSGTRTVECREFRKIVSSVAFQEKYTLPENERNAALKDDLNLLRFGISWLKKHLFTEEDEK